MKIESHRTRKLKTIVLTGAPSSGKSSTAEALRTGSFGLSVVPETASLLLGSGYPPPTPGNVEEAYLFQRAIWEVQSSRESMMHLRAQNAQKAGCVILDRGTLDGAAYWPRGASAFFRDLELDPEEELARYDHVLFFHLPPREHFGGLNVQRYHNYDQSMEIGERLFEIWSRHPKLVSVPFCNSLPEKVAYATRKVMKLAMAPTTGTLRSMPRSPALRLHALLSDTHRETPLSTV